MSWFEVVLFAWFACLWILVTSGRRFLTDFSESGKIFWRWGMGNAPDYADKEGRKARRCIAAFESFLSLFYGDSRREVTVTIEILRLVNAILCYR